MPLFGVGGGGSVQFSQTQNHMPIPSWYITLAGAVEPTQHSSVSEERSSLSWNLFGWQPGSLTQWYWVPQHGGALTRFHWWRLGSWGFLDVQKGVTVPPEHKSLFFSTDSRFVFVNAVTAVTCFKFSSVWLSSRFSFTMEEQLRKHVHGKERPCALRESLRRKTANICLTADT